MNRALLFIVAAALVAFILIQVEGQGYYGYGGYGGFVPGAARARAGGNAQALAVNQYYQNYYKRYNTLQTFSVLRNLISGLRTSSLLSLASLFAIALFTTNATQTLVG